VILPINPSQVILDVVALKSNGDAKTNVTSAIVRVYNIVGGLEVDVLATTPLVQVGVTNVWRYIWTPTSLAEGYYIAEYKMSDSDEINTTVCEDITIGYLENTLNTIASNVDTIKEIEVGKWQMVNNQLILYKADNVTEIARFALFDENNEPTMESVVKRVRV